MRIVLTKAKTTKSYVKYEAARTQPAIASIYMPLEGAAEPHPETIEIDVPWGQHAAQTA